MTSFFTQLLFMSLKGSIIIAAALMMRPLLKKNRMWPMFLLWIMAALRLIMPVSVKSSVSVIPEKEVLTFLSPEIISSKEAISSEREEMDQKTEAADPASDPAKLSIPGLLPYMAVTGTILMLGYGMMQRISIAHRIRARMKVREGVFICDYIDAPFVSGIVKPVIMIPSDIPEENYDCIIAHERAHILRQDMVWKTLGYAVLSIHWFNPLVWAGYLFFCRDLELSCDEAALKDKDLRFRKRYAETLLELTAGKTAGIADPLSFSEGNVVERISVMGEKKKKWITYAGIAVCLMTALLFMTDPISAAKKNYSREEAEAAAGDLNEALTLLYEKDPSGYDSFTNHFGGSIVEEDRLRINYKGKSSDLDAVMGLIPEEKRQVIELRKVRYSYQELAEAMEEIWRDKAAVSHTDKSAIAAALASIQGIGINQAENCLDILTFPLSEGEVNGLYTAYDRKMIHIIKINSYSTGLDQSPRLDR